MEDNKLTIFRTCPNCKKDILKHKEALIYIRTHGEQIKREIANYKNSRPHELYIKYIYSEIEKFTKKIVDMERKIASPLYKMNQRAYILLESWRNIVNIYKNELAPPSSCINKSTDGNLQKLSYKWQGKPETDLPELFKLVKGKFINKDTSFNQFKAVFSQQPIGTFTPIKWHKSNASELLYFILLLIRAELIAGNEKRMDYKKLKACFVMPNGKSFTERFKTLKQNVSYELSQDKQDVIAKLVEQFK